MKMKVFVCANGKCDMNVWIRQLDNESMDRLVSWTWYLHVEWMHLFKNEKLSIRSKLTDIVYSFAIFSTPFADFN